jgi:hypothetical protein
MGKFIPLNYFLFINSKFNGLQISFSIKKKIISCFWLKMGGLALAAFFGIRRREKFGFFAVDLWGMFCN